MRREAAGVAHMRVAGRSGREGHCSVAIRLSRLSRQTGCYTRNASAPASEAAFLASRGLSHLATFWGGPNTPPSLGTFVMESQSPPLNPFPPPSCFHQPIHVTVLSPPCCACQAAITRLRAPDRTESLCTQKKAFGTLRNAAPNLEDCALPAPTASAPLARS